MKNNSLSDKNKIILLEISRKTLEFHLENKTYIPSNYKDEELNSHSGAFVTLTNNKQLRGCIGRFKSEIPLYKLIQEMSIAAATQDSRFHSVSFEELEEINIEISVLTPLKKINSINEIEIGKHGIYIKKGFQNGTLLPQVATENNWDKHQFLNYCSEYKAGIGKEGWKNAQIYTYEAIIFSEK